MKKPKTAQIKPNLRKYLIAVQDQLDADGTGELAEANEINRTFLNQLFVMAGGLITLSSPIFIDRSVLTSLSHSMRGDLSGAIVLAALSIFFGFVQLFSERIFVSRSAFKKFDAADAIGRGEVKSASAAKLLLNGIKPSRRASSDFFTGLQVLTLLVAAFEYITVMTHVLRTF